MRCGITSWEGRSRPRMVPNCSIRTTRSTWGVARRAAPKQELSLLERNQKINEFKFEKCWHRNRAGCWRIPKEVLEERVEAAIVKEIKLHKLQLRGLDASKATGGHRGRR